MAWVEKRKAENRTSRYRMREKINGENVTVIHDLGTQKGIADIWNLRFKEAIGLGYKYIPPITIDHIKEFLDAVKSGKEAPNAKRIKLTELCSLWLDHYGPSLKPADKGRDHYRSAYHGLDLRLEQLKKTPLLGPDGKPSGRTWADMWVDEINHYHVRDLLARYDSPGTKLRWLGSCGAMFRGAAEWNRLGNVIPFKIRLPAYNPFKEWRNIMKPAEKDEQPDMRVLEPEEWYAFRPHLPAKTRAICEMALFRFLSLADIRVYANKGHEEGDLVHARREKSGELYVVPFLSGSPARYDFTDFVGSFRRAQIKAGMNYPVGHPKHFSPKDLRRTGATWAYRKKKDLVTISKMLGHKKLTTTQHYLGTIEADYHAIAEALQEIINADPVEQTRQRVC